VTVTLVLAQGLGGVHGLSEPIGAVYNSQHGLTNAVLLPYVLEVNRAEIEAKCKMIVQCVGLRPTGIGDFDTVMQWVLELRRRLSIPTSLVDLGVAESDVGSVAIKAAANATGFTNPKVLEAHDYEAILRAALNGNL